MRNQPNDLPGSRGESVSSGVSAHLAALIESTQDLIWSVDLENRLVAFNRAFAQTVEKTFGVTVRTGMTPFDTAPPEQASLWPPMYARALTEGPYRTESVMADGRWLDLSFSRIIENGAPIGISVFGKDITERKLAEEFRKRSERRLHESEARFRTLVESAPSAISISRNGLILYANQKCAELLGLPAPDAVIGRSVLDCFAPETREEIERHRRSYLQGEIDSATLEGIALRSNGAPFPVQIEAVAVDLPDGPGVLSFLSDISDRKASEEAIRNHIREIQLLSEMNAALLHATTEGDLLREYCRIVVETGGYRMAWVGFAEPGTEKRVIPLAQFGHEDGYLKVADVRWDSSTHGEGPIGRAIKSGKIVAVENFSTDAQSTPWHEEAARRDYKSLIAIPFRDPEGGFACLAAYGSSTSRWSTSELKLMEQIAAALGFGITTVRTAIARDRFQCDLHNSLEQTIKLISEMVEQRDPYTAGHQRRVADLCSRIAERLGLAPFRIQGLRLAATIHDLGKIAIPAEILAKPGQLTPIQYELLKEHTELGFDIVKNVSFPWPIAEIIRQHHERLDGSGYPHGLERDAILLESRILAVADVVEAMGSHRPYRAARGLEAALSEVVAERGKLYDADAVDACIILFQKEGYAFPA